MLVRWLLLCSMVGLFSYTAFLILLGLAFLRFKFLRKKPAPIPDAEGPRASLLKPVHGLEADLERNLESFFCQDYPAYEVIFGCRHASDPALGIVNDLRQRYPRVPVKIVLSGEPDRPNAKVCSLEKMVAVAESDYLVMSDSDVRVTPPYLREVVRPLLEPKVGLVTCLYRGQPTGGPWARLEALGMSVEMTAGVVVADMLEGMRFALGPTMAVRRDALNAIGGVGVLADYCADDFVLGKKIHEADFQVVLSSHVVDHVVVNHGLFDSLRHQLRWMKSTRFSRPKGHLGSGLTFAMPFGILAMVACIALGARPWAFAVLAWALFNCMAEAVIAGGLLVGDRQALRYCWLYPLRDLMGFLVWCASFMGTSIVWRGERYRLRPGGIMAREAGVAPLVTEPAQGRLV